MAYKTVITCDVCPKTLEADGTPQNWMLFRREHDTARRSLIFFSWDPDDAMQLGHVCSPECAKELLGIAAAEWRVAP